MSAPQRPGRQPNRPTPPYGAPNETEWIPRVQDQRRDVRFGDPIRFEEEQGPPPPANPALTWTLRIAGLVAVAVVSGLLWGYLQSDSSDKDTGSSPSVPQSAPAGRFNQLALVDGPKVEQDCSKHSYDDVQRFFKNNPCVKLTRVLYKGVINDKTIYAAVMVVRMPDVAKATEFRALVNKDGTGNVKDPINAGIVKVEGLETLANGGYKDHLQGQDVIIVESDFAPQGKRSEAERAFLKEVSDDAVRFGLDIAGKP